jgi:hypothetical protein
VLRTIFQLLIAWRVQFHLPLQTLDGRWCYPLNCNPFDLIERDLIASAIVELRRARAFVRGHGLRVLERSAGLEIGRDTRRAKCMTSNLDAHAEIRGAALNHAPGVDTVHRLVGQYVGAAGSGAEERAFAILADAGGLYVGVQVGSRL